MEVQSFPVQNVESGKLCYANSLMAHQIASFRFWWFNEAGEMKVVWVTRIPLVIEKSSAFAITMFEKALEIIDIKVGDELELMIDGGLYFRSYWFLFTQMVRIHLRFKIHVEDIFLMDEHGKVFVDGQACI